MPLPRKGKKEKRSKFMSRCVSELAKKGEGKDTNQRVAICNSQFEKARAEEILDELDKANGLSKLVSEVKDGEGLPLRGRRNKVSRKQLED